ncbi:MAG: 50S ribosomal protein L4 [Patescibacteria group bacterium]|nr:50S ribosomal protein L4 [Patescibacteria group bacterium]
MIKVDVKDISGKVVGQETLEPKIFEVKLKPDLVHQVVVAQGANARRVIAHAKDRSEVRGGGRKPWRQKGTGRARHGSIRSPIWRGGGVTFGPTKDRNFSQKINIKMRRQALFMSLSDRARNKRILVLDKLEITEPKTKIVAGICKTLGLSGGKTLFVIQAKDTNIQRSIHNISNVDVLPANSLNILAILKHGQIVFTREALTKVSQVYLGK